MIENTSIRPLSVSEFARRLKDARRPLFLMHRRPDGDTVGSTAALMHLSRAMGNTPFGLCADRVPERLAFLVSELPVGMTLPEGELTPIAVDVASVSQLGAVADLPLCVSMMLDHHEIGVPFADHLIFPRAAAAGEVVFAVAEELVKQGALPAIPSEAKRAMYTALSSDTGCFRYSNATATTLRCAAALLEDGSVDASDVNHRLFEAKSEKQLRAEAFAIEHTQTLDGGRIGYAIITDADRRALGVEEEHLETVIDMVRSRAGAEIALAIREQENGALRASMRSSGFDVASVAAYFGGGGHLRAAGCTVQAESPRAAAERVLAEIRRRLNQQR